MKLVAIDFETANENSASACSLGITTYEDGEIKESYAFYIKPLSRYRYFKFTYIHHITLEDIIDEHEFDYYYDKLKEEFKGAVLVAHNANFDINVLNAMCDCYGLDHFTNEYIDTVTLSRKLYPSLVNHRLNTICDYLGIELNHHEAQSDSYASMMIVLNAMINKNVYNIHELLKILHVKKRYNE